MTREQFDKLYLDRVIHCDTEEKANHFLALGNSVGYRWNSRKSLIEGNEWKRFEKETCYEVTKYGFMFSDKKNFELDGYQIIEYEPQPKFKVGDKIKIKSISYPYLNEKVGVIESVDLLSPISYAVKVGLEGWTAWFYENELEKARRWTINATDLRYMLKAITEEKANSMTDEELEDFIVDTLVGERYE